MSAAPELGPQTCDACGQPATLLEVIENADLEPWHVCAACLRDDDALDPSEERTSGDRAPA